MVVAMNPDLGGVRAAIEDELLLREDFLFRSENLRGLIPERIGERRQFLFEQSEVAPKRGAHVLKNGALRHGVELLRSECAVVGTDGQGSMELPGSSSQELGFFRINPANQFLEQRAGRSRLTLQIR